MLLFEKNKKKAKNRNGNKRGIIHNPRLLHFYKKGSSAHFLLASTHLRALTNASTQGVIWSLFTRSAG